MKEVLLATEQQMDDIVAGLAVQLIDDNEDPDEIVLVGIQSRGVPLAQKLSDVIMKRIGKRVLVGSLDISLYRDDLSEIAPQPTVGKTKLSFDVKGKGIILVDDVLFTGRTIRAAMDELIDFGRPKFIKLLVMVDRGWREFPIQADYVGIKIKTVLTDNIKVMVRPVDQEYKIVKRSL